MKKISEKILFEGTWLSVHELLYQNQHGEALTWETVRRSKINVGVIVIARLKHSKEYILIKQYRPSINGFILSFPAGLGIGDAQHALTELLEETGYVGTIVSISPLLKAGASIIDDSALIVHVEVDERSLENINPQQKLEPAENIQVCRVTMKDAQAFLLQEHAKGTQISTNIWVMFCAPLSFHS